MPFRIALSTGCEDYKSMTDCLNNATCSWSSGQNICFGGTNWYQIFQTLQCDSTYNNITQPINVRINLTNSAIYCDEISTIFVENSPHWFTAYGTFENSQCNGLNIQASNISSAELYCENVALWEPCEESTIVSQVDSSFQLQTKKFHCICGQLRYTVVNKTVVYGGLSHHGTYTWYGTRDRVDRKHPTCLQEFSLYFHL